MCKLNKKIQALASQTLLAILVSACTISSPNSGEITPQEIQYQDPLLVADGIKTFDRLKLQIPVTQNHLVETAGGKLAKISPLSKIEWEFVTFQNRIPNSFALPGGKIGVNTGILPIAQSEAGVATIIAHEMAHIALAHHHKITQRETAHALIHKLAKTSTTKELQHTKDALLQPLPTRSQMEIKADQLGLLYMAQAGYDPNEAILFWERFQAYKSKTGQGSSKFFSSHPLDQTRIKKLRTLLPPAIKLYLRSRN